MYFDFKFQLKPSISYSAIKHLFFKKKVWKCKNKENAYKYVCGKMVIMLQLSDTFLLEYMRFFWNDALTCNSEKSQTFTTEFYEKNNCHLIEIFFICLIRFLPVWIVKHYVSVCFYIYFHFDIFM
jgi:hypothetical protein